MATRYLGDQIDIHGGGADLIFPHHPCEIAQTEPVTGKRPFVKIWMHAGLVWLDGEKMSKSLGNLVFARDALREHGADALRWYLMTQHYREDFDYNRTAVQSYGQLALQLRQAVAACGGQSSPLDLSIARDEFIAAMADDLNTPAALAILHTMVGETLNAAAEGRAVEGAAATVRELALLFGFTLGHDLS